MLWAREAELPRLGSQRGRWEPAKLGIEIIGIEFIDGLHGVASISKNSNAFRFQLLSWERPLQG